MYSSGYFRKKAEECRMLAEQAATEHARLAMLRAAANYDGIADSYELTERAKARLAKSTTPLVKK
jgi:hypothetical protein